MFSTSTSFYIYLSGSSRRGFQCNTILFLESVNLIEFWLKIFFQPANHGRFRGIYFCYSINTFTKTKFIKLIKIFFLLKNYNDISRCFIRYFLHDRNMMQSCQRFFGDWQWWLTAYSADPQLSSWLWIATENGFWVIKIYVIYPYNLNYLLIQTIFWSMITAT